MRSPRQYPPLSSSQEPQLSTGELLLRRIEENTDVTRDNRYMLGQLDGRMDGIEYRLGLQHKELRQYSMHFSEQMGGAARRLQKLEDDVQMIKGTMHPPPKQREGLLWRSMQFVRETLELFPASHRLIIVGAVIFSFLGLLKPHEIKQWIFGHPLGQSQSTPAPSSGEASPQ